MAGFVSWKCYEPRWKQPWITQSELLSVVVVVWINWWGGAGEGWWCQYWFAIVDDSAVDLGVDWEVGESFPPCGVLCPVFSLWLPFCPPLHQRFLFGRPFAPIWINMATALLLLLTIQSILIIWERKKERKEGKDWLKLLNSIRLGPARDGHPSPMDGPLSDGSVGIEIGLAQRKKSRP